MNRRTPQVRWPLALPDLRPYLNLGALARPLGAGTVILARKTCAWCAAGKGSGAVAARTGGALFGVLCVGEAVTMYPAAAPSILVGGWLIAALAVAPTPPHTPEPAPDDEPNQGPSAPAPQPTDSELLHALIRTLIGTQNATRLDTLYPAMRTHLPGLTHADDKTLRQHLRNHHIPIRKSVRAGGITGRSGVHVDDLPQHHTHNNPHHTSTPPVDQPPPAETHTP